MSLHCDSPHPPVPLCFRHSGVPLPAHTPQLRVSRPTDRPQRRPQSAHGSRLTGQRSPDSQSGFGRVTGSPTSGPALGASRVAITAHIPSRLGLGWWLCGRRLRLDRPLCMVV